MFFMQLLKSLDEFLFEVMSWLVFYPVTLWRALRHPLKMMDYADTELKDRVDEQYTEALSPPVFLLLSVLLSHGIELALIGESPIVAERRGLAGLINDDTSLLMLRLLLFSIFPLIMALRLVRSRGRGLNRNSLRPPFFSQCYVTAPFVLAVGIAVTVMQLPLRWAPLAGFAGILVALLWFGLLQSRWFALRLNVSFARGFLTASVAMVECLAIVLLVAYLFR